MLGQNILRMHFPSAKDRSASPGAIADIPAGRFQLVMRLQLLRASLTDGHNHGLSQRQLLNGLMQNIRSVTVVAADFGLAGYWRMCREVIRRLEAMMKRGAVPPRLFALVVDWAASSELYIRRPKFRPFAQLLVRQLDDPLWNELIGEVDQSEMIHDLAMESQTDGTYLQAVTHTRHST